MQAIRKIVLVHDDFIKLAIPKGFTKKKVEVIILPHGQNEAEKSISDSSPAEQLSDFQKLLLAGPVMSDAEYEAFLAKRKHFNAWK